MRTAILALIVVIVLLIIAFATGFLDLEQTRSAKAPDISANASGVTAAGGQPPAFDIETGKVAIGSEPKNVTVAVPTLEIQRPKDNEAAPADKSN